MASKRKKRDFEQKIKDSALGMKCPIHDKGFNLKSFEWFETVEDGKLVDKVTVKSDPCCDEFDIKLFAKLEKDIGYKKPN